MPLGEIVVRPRRQRGVPSIVSVGEFQRVIMHAEGVERLIFQLLFGAGLRLLEALDLRIRDINFKDDRIHVRDNDGKSSRSTVLPAGLKPDLLRHLTKVRTVHCEDLREGYGRILIPYALWKENPRRAKDLVWQYVFPAPRRTRDPRKGAIRRSHLSVRTVNRRLAEAVAQAGVRKQISCSCLRRSFGFHLLATGCDPALVQKQLGCKSVASFGIALARSWIASPLDLL